MMANLTLFFVLLFAILSLLRNLEKIFHFRRLYKKPTIRLAL